MLPVLPCSIHRLRAVLCAAVCGVALAAGVFASAARAQTPGDLDPSFNPGSGANGQVSVITVQNDGKIIVGGQFTSFNGTAQNYLARLNADGSLDTGFATGTGANNSVTAVAVQSDGKIVLGGSFTAINGTASAYIARLNADGSVDTTFNPGTGADNVVSSVALQGDGKIVLAGSFVTFNSVPTPFSIARLNADGSVDTTFQVGLNAGSRDVSKVAVQGDGKIVLTGSFADAANDGSYTSVARLNADGSVDTSFNTSFGFYETQSTLDGDLADALALESDGKIIVLGYDISAFSPDYGGPVASRLNTDGSTETGLYAGSYFGGVYTVSGLAVQADGKVLIGGYVSFFTRDHADGSADTAFNAQATVKDDVICIAVQSDTNILVGGALPSVDGVAANNIARLLGDGIPGGVHFSATSYQASENGGRATITVNRSDNGTAAVSVDYATVNQTAAANVDYTPVSGTLSWALGDTSPKTFQVPITDRNLTAGNPTLLLTLSNATGGAVIDAPASVTLTIVDTPVVSVAASVPVAHLDGDQPGEFTFSITAAPAVKTVIDYVLKGTAINGQDYVLLTGHTKIKPGKTSRTVQVVPEGDLEGATHKKVKLTLLPPADGSYQVDTTPAKVKIVNP